MHLISAWAAENRLVLGQPEVDAGENEIRVLLELLQILALEGCIVTIDAIGCQSEIAQTIRDQGADYVLAVKDNQPKLHERLQRLFSNAPQGSLMPWQHDHYRLTDKGHGPIEIREAWTVYDPAWLAWLDPTYQ